MQSLAAYSTEEGARVVEDLCMAVPDLLSTGVMLNPLPHRN